MFETFAQGILFGLFITVFSFGPVFFALIQTSIVRGFAAGAALAVGVMLADLVLILIAYFGLSSFIENPDNRSLVAIVGGVVLILFGLASLFRKSSLRDQPKLDLKGFTYPALMAKGFLLNATNPSVVFFWVLIVGFVSAKAEYQTEHVVAFFTASLVTVLTTDLIKAYVSQRISRWLWPSLLTWVHRITGMILIAFGGFLIMQVFL